MNMKLDDELNKLKDNIPENNLDYKVIYNKSKIKSNRTINSKRLMYLTLAIVGALIISICSIFPFIKNDTNNYSDQLVSLIQDINYEKVNEEPIDYDLFIDKYNIFSEKIASELVNNGENNVVSPYSIFSCLVLISAVCDNNSKDEILNALDMSEELILNNYPYFYSKHNYEINTLNVTGTKESTYNSIWIQHGLETNKNTIDSLTNNYYCYPYYINFKNNVEANKIIKEYVYNNTEGLINQNFNLSSDTIISLINVNYLKDAWKDGDLTKTDNYNFTNNDNTTKNVQFNKTEYILGKIQKEVNYSHFYTRTRRYNIKFVLPDNNINIHDIFNNELISNVNNSTYTANDDNIYLTSCIFPTFKLESDLITLNDILSNKFGIKDIFNISKCDLSKLLNVDAYFSKIIHKAVLEVNEKGIKAAAVTMGIVETTSINLTKEPIYEDFILDKSFGVIITNFNDEILYTGIVDNI